jgi:hypothetical protein
MNRSSRTQNWCMQQRTSAPHGFRCRVQASAAMPCTGPVGSSVPLAPLACPMQNFVAGTCLHGVGELHVPCFELAANLSLSLSLRAPSSQVDQGLPTTCESATPCVVSPATTVGGKLAPRSLALAQVFFLSFRTL